MERIRAAIDKARQERHAVNKSQPAAAPKTTSPTDEADAILLQEEWRALASFHVDTKWLKRHRITTSQANADSTPFDVMRTKLLHQMRTNNWRRIAITSPGSSCGKSTICLNLAFSLARQPDLKVMVIELDLRRPALARMLRLRDDVDFANVIAGRSKADKHMRRYGDRLAIATCRKTPDSAELLQSVTAAHVIDDLEARYQPDVMIFDMPPLLVVDDTMAFIDQVDATLLVGAAEASTLDELNRCTLELENRTNLLGVVLNKCRYPDPTENYGYDR